MLPPSTVLSVFQLSQNSNKMKLTDKLINALGWDKLLHYLAGFSLCAVICYGAQANVGCAAWEQAVAGTLIGLLLGVGKELLDTTFDWADVAATVAGSTTMGLLAVALSA